MSIQMRLVFSDVEMIFAKQGTCSCCGDDILVGDAHSLGIDGSLRCRQCKPDFLAQFDEVISVLSNETDTHWQDNDVIADFVVDAYALMTSITGHDYRAPSTAVIVGILLECETISDKFDALEDTVLRLCRLRSELPGYDG